MTEFCIHFFFFLLTILASTHCQKFILCTYVFIFISIYVLKIIYIILKSIVSVFFPFYSILFICNSFFSLISTGYIYLINPHKESAFTFITVFVFSLLVSISLFLIFPSFFFQILLCFLFSTYLIWMFSLFVLRLICAPIDAFEAKHVSLNTTIFLPHRYHVVCH